jgi:Uma2 family endonuclease
MAMPAPSQLEWTAEMARALPEDGNRYEVIDGELLVTPAPSQRHQRAMELLYLAIAPYARALAHDGAIRPAQEAPDVPERGRARLLDRRH